MVSDARLARSGRCSTEACLCVLSLDVTILAVIPFLEGSYPHPCIQTIEHCVAQDDHCHQKTACLGPVLVDTALKHFTIHLAHRAGRSASGRCTPLHSSQLGLRFRPRDAGDDRLDQSPDHVCVVLAAVSGQ